MVQIRSNLINGCDWTFFSCQSKGCTELTGWMGHLKPPIRYLGLLSQELHFCTMWFWDEAHPWPRTSVSRCCCCSLLGLSGSDSATGSSLLWIQNESKIKAFLFLRDKTPSTLRKYAWQSILEYEVNDCTILGTTVSNQLQSSLDYLQWPALHSWAPSSCAACMVGTCNPQCWL